MEVAKAREEASVRVMHAPGSSEHPARTEHCRLKIVLGHSTPQSLVTTVSTTLQYYKYIHQVRTLPP